MQRAFLNRLYEENYRILITCNEWIKTEWRDNIVSHLAINEKFWRKYMFNSYKITF